MYVRDASCKAHVSGSRAALREGKRPRVLTLGNQVAYTILHPWSPQVHEAMHFVWLLTIETDLKYKLEEKAPKH